MAKPTFYLDSYPLSDGSMVHDVWTETQPFNDAEGSQRIHCASSREQAEALVEALNNAVTSVLGI